MDPDSDVESGEESTTSTPDGTSEHPTRPTTTATPSASDNSDGSDSGSINDTMATPTVTQTVSPDGEPFPTSSNDDTGGRGDVNSGDGGGAGMVSPQEFVVLGLVLVGGLFLVR